VALEMTIDEFRFVVLSWKKLRYRPWHASPAKSW
jgi:hypothetical protein